jgi:Anti-sigma factor NepR
MSAAKKDVKMSAGSDVMTATAPPNPKSKPEASMSAAAESQSNTRLEADLQAHLGTKLKAVYQTLVDEPVPEKFLELLDELERREGKR